MDFQALIKQLRKTMTLAEIGTAVGLTGGTIGDLARGRYVAPNWHAGQKLIALALKKRRK